MPLSEFTIRHARITGKNYTLGDFDGLSLGVSKAGGKIWLFRYYWEGRQKRMSFGTYPEVSLKQARERRDEARKLLAENVNPCAHRKQQRREAAAEEKHTFQAVYDEWINFRRLSLNEGRQSTLSQILRVFKKDVLPTLAERPIKSITRHDLLAILSTIEQRKAFTMAEKCRTWFNQLFRYALVKVEGIPVALGVTLLVLALKWVPVFNNVLGYFLGTVCYFASHLPPSLSTLLDLAVALSLGVIGGFLASVMNRYWSETGMRSACG